MSLQLSAEQERARAAILSWYRSPHRKPWFLLNGGAGVGKTSCVKATTEAIPGNVLYIAPTARAALMMRRKGCEDPRTVHSAIYIPKGLSGNRKQVEMLRELMELGPGPRADGLRDKLKPLLETDLKRLQAQFDRDRQTNPKTSTPAKLDDLRKALTTNISNARDLIGVNPLFELNPESMVKQADLIVVDECSMVSDRVMRDILSFNIPVLAQGDPYQLPPVRSVGFFDNVEPDFELTEIHRQEADNPIIHLATLLRQGRSLTPGNYGESVVSRRSSAEEAMLADQVIVGKNATRQASNDKMRLALGRSGPTPEPGDRMICRSNNHERGLVNGDQFEALWYRDGSPYATMCVENASLKLTVPVHKEYFHRKEPNPWMRKKAECMEFAFVITCHNSQGGEWPYVYVKDESYCFKADRWRWAYTAATRASRKLYMHI